MVRFQIPCELRVSHYYVWLRAHFDHFVRLLSGHAVNQWAAERLSFVGAVTPESSLGGIYIGKGKENFSGYELVIYDGGINQPIDNWKGIMMRHRLDTVSKVAPLYQLAEKFEKYLIRKRIPYQRFGRFIDEPGEWEQITKFRKS